MKLSIRVDAQFYELKELEIENMKKSFRVQKREGQDGRHKFHV